MFQVVNKSGLKTLFLDNEEVFSSYYDYSDMSEDEEKFLILVDFSKFVTGELKNLGSKLNNINESSSNVIKMEEVHNIKETLDRLNKWSSEIDREQDELLKSVIGKKEQKN